MSTCLDSVVVQHSALSEPLFFVQRKGPRVQKKPARTFALQKKKRQQTGGDPGSNPGQGVEYLSRLPNVKESSLMFNSLTAFLVSV